MVLTGEFVGTQTFNLGLALESDASFLLETWAGPIWRTRDVLTRPTIPEPWTKSNVCVEVFVEVVAKVVEVVEVVVGVYVGCEVAEVVEQEEDELG